MMKKLLAALTLAVVGLIGVSGCGGGDHRTSPTTSNAPRADTSALDSVYIAELARLGADTSDRDKLINAGHEICTRLQHEGSIEATSDVMRAYDLPPGQHGIEGVYRAAVDVYCPVNANGATAAPTPQPRSSILDVALPEGFSLFHSDSTPNYRSETWESAGSTFQHTVDAIRPQLPVGAALDGIPWCTESHKPITGSRVVMFWVSADTGQPAVEVEVESDVNPPDNPKITVYIGRWVTSVDTCAAKERLEEQ
jgi:hypothetical protein